MLTWDDLLRMHSNRKQKMNRSPLKLTWVALSAMLAPWLAALMAALLMSCATPTLVRPACRNPLRS